jgi:hypothetical protein
MESVRIPIDIIFMDEHFFVVGIHRNAKPYDTTPIESKVPFRYAVEVNAGWCAYNAIYVGCKAEISGVL